MIPVPSNLRIERIGVKNWKELGSYQHLSRKLGSGEVGVVFQHLSFLLFFLFKECVKFLLMPVSCRAMEKRLAHAWGTCKGGAGQISRGNLMRYSPSGVNTTCGTCNHGDDGFLYGVRTTSCGRGRDALPYTEHLGRIDTKNIP